MKKLLLATLFLFAGIPVAAQTTTLLASGGIGLSCNAVTTASAANPGTVGGCTAFAMVASGNSLPSTATWQVITTGTPASVTVNLMGSLDGVTWSQADTASAAGTRNVTAIAYRYLGCVVATLTGGSSPTVTCQISVSVFAPSSTGTINANSGGTNVLARYVSAGGSTTVSPTTKATDDDTTLTYTGTGGILSTTSGGLKAGANGGAAGKLSLLGSTSGSATLTAPAVAGTTSNGVTSSNTILVPSITNCTTPGLAFTGNTTTGLFATTNIFFACANGSTAFSATSGGFAPSGTHVTLIQNTAPTIAAGGCGGAAASIPNNNGPAAFTINVGTTPGSACTFTLPSVGTTDYVCNASDLTTATTSVFFQKQTGAASANSATITNFNTAGAATAFGASDVLRVSCFSY